MSEQAKTEQQAAIDNLVQMAHGFVDLQFKIAFGSLIEGKKEDDTTARDTA